MSISKDDAAQALSEIDQARGRVRSLAAYAQAAPYLVLWGIAWLVADTAIALSPRAFWVWPAVIAVATLVNVGIAVAQAREVGAGQTRSPHWKALATALICVVFLASLFLVLSPLGGKQIHSVFGLFFGSVYVVMGLWLGWRLVALGLALAGLTLVAYYALPMGGGYPLFMGVVAGGALIVGGLWLRKI